MFFLYSLIEKNNLKILSFFLSESGIGDSDLLINRSQIVTNSFLKLISLKFGK
jgi:hypothetical protein